MAWGEKCAATYGDKGQIESAYKIDPQTGNREELYNGLRNSELGFGAAGQTAFLSALREIDGGCGATFDVVL